jgi:uncharacterized protein (TIGR02996 family)
MNQEEAFLATLADDPDDEVTRLVFADWIEEQGDPERAEFIRIQCRLANLATDDPERPALEQREIELYRKGAPRWLGRAGLDLLFGEAFDPESQKPLGPRWEGDLDAFAFERGWLHSLCYVWMSGAGIWRRMLRAGFAAPVARLLHTFESWYIEEDESWDPPARPVEDPLEGVLDGQSLPSLRVLKLGGPELYDYIAGVPRQTASALPRLLEGLPRLAELHLNAHGVDYQAVFSPGRLPLLRRLRLTTQCASDQACEALADSGLLPHLQVLELAGSSEGRLTTYGRGLLLWGSRNHLRLLEEQADATGIQSLRFERDGEQGGGP